MIFSEQPETVYFDSTGEISRYSYHLGMASLSYGRDFLWDWLNAAEISEQIDDALQRIEDGTAESVR